MVARAKLEISKLFWDPPMRKSRFVPCTMQINVINYRLTGWVIMSVRVHMGARAVLQIQC